MLLRIYIKLLLFSLSAEVCTGQVYNYYYGNIHAHSAYSDGNKENTSLYDCPAEDYAYAKKSQNFHFLGISEHNHGDAGMARARYADGLAEADAANQDSVFVTLYGMEWGTISKGGHVIIYGYDKLMGWENGNYDEFVDTTDYATLFTKIARKPGAFACLAHPEITDYDSLFYKAHNETFDSAIVGTAIRSGPAFSTDTTYSNPSTSSDEARYRDLLKIGYHLGAGIDHDNHYTTFGRTTQSRTVVLATALTRENIIDAYRNSRFYASDDWNLKVNFTVNGQPLGTIFSEAGAASISVSVSDDDAETVSSIRVYYGVPGSGANPTTLTSNTGSSTLSFTHNINDGTTYYYYVVVTQADGHKAFTSPIRYTRNSGSTLPVELAYFDAVQLENTVELKWATLTETNNHGFYLERSGDAFNFVPVGFVKGNGTSSAGNSYEFIDGSPLPGISYYRIKQEDDNGKVKYFPAEGVEFKPVHVAGAFSVHPVPALSKLNVSFQAYKSGQVDLRITDPLAREVCSWSLFASEGNNNLVLPVENLPAGTYNLLVSLPGQPTEIFRVVLCR